MTLTVEKVRLSYPGAGTFQFGDMPGLVAKLTGLVRSGAKRATCTALADIEAGHVTMPEVGRRDIALNVDGTPALVIETRELRRTTWADLSEDMALAEGENDAPDMPLIWERFEVVEDFG